MHLLAITCIYHTNLHFRNQLFMATIGIIGGTGFVGKYLTQLLVSKGHWVIIFSRNPTNQKPTLGVSYALFNYKSKKYDLDALQEIDTVINLAGAGVADKPWTAERKKEIRDSRVLLTHFLVETLKSNCPNCHTYIGASAIGYYGEDSLGKPPFTETDNPSNDFLGNTCKEWEEATLTASATMRTVIVRIGIVLGLEGGAFPQFYQPLRMGIRPIIGSGKQIVSWIHLHDLAAIFEFASTNAISGIFNAVAPHPLSQNEFMKTIHAVKGGIAIPAPAPAFLLKAILGEFSIEILKSATVSSEKIINQGFRFKYPELNAAIKQLLNK